MFLKSLCAFSSIIFILGSISLTNGAPATTASDQIKLIEIQNKLGNIEEIIQFMESALKRDIRELKYGQTELRDMLRANLNLTTTTISANTLDGTASRSSPLTGNNQGQVVGPGGVLNKGKLSFKVSGRGFPDKDTGFGTSDGYFELFWSEDGGKSRTKIGRSDTVADNENPDWGNTFTYDFDRSKEQLWYFKVYDEDHLREDDNIGRVWVSVKDYVDKGQFANVYLHKQGYLIIKSSEPQKLDPTRNVPIGSMSIPSGVPASQTLRFKVSASGLPTKDDIGFIPGNSDPYVIINAMDGVGGTERQIGRSSTVSNTKNPVWGEVFTIPWDSKKDQRLHFKIYDDDKLRDDDKLGGGWLELNDYVAHGQAITFNTPNGGKITLTKA